VIGEGLAACERLLPAERSRFCFGDSPTLADICLIPQLANARRFGAALDWPKLLRIEHNCLELPAFSEALPARQPDAQV
jgi:maleylpyruvate isomerase